MHKGFARRDDYLKITTRHNFIARCILFFGYHVLQIILAVKETDNYRFFLFETTARFRITVTTNGRNDHVITFILYLPLPVFGISVKLSSFALARKTRIVLHYSHRHTVFRGLDWSGLDL